MPVCNAVVGPVHVLHFAEIDSTNAEALRRAAALPDRAVLTTDQQTAGRGRRGRAWTSSRDNVALSVFARTARPAAPPGGMAIAVGIAIAEALQARGLTAVQLKWPNDLQVDGRKLGGILVEMARLEPSRAEWVIGVGLNCRLPADLDIGQPWTDLAGCGLELQRDAAADLVVAAVLGAVECFVEHGLAPLLTRWDRFDALRGREVAVEGGARAGGCVLGLAADGALRLRDDRGDWCCHAGEVSVRPR